MMLFPRKLQTHWDGPFIIKQVFPHGDIELIVRYANPFKVSRHRVKHYEEGMPIEETKGENMKFSVTTSM